MLQMQKNPTNEQFIHLTFTTQLLLLLHCQPHLLSIVWGFKIILTMLSSIKREHSSEVFQKKRNVILFQLVDCQSRSHMSPGEISNKKHAERKPRGKNVGYNFRLHCSGGDRTKRTEGEKNIIKSNSVVSDFAVFSTRRFCSGAHYMLAIFSEYFLI